MNDITRNADMFCSYYQAHVDRPQCWFVVATLKSYDHVAFDRTINTETNLFEFFVPREMEQLFLAIMDRFDKEGLVWNLKKLPNRLIDSLESL